jgi:hypothetical protein
MSNFELLISDDMSVLLLLAARTPERNKERIVSFMSSCVESEVSSLARKDCELMYSEQPCRSVVSLST